MARNLGTSGGPVPPAVRTSTPGWRDPRLWIGVAIVAASVLVGTRVLASADDTVQVWAVTADAAPGERLDEADLQARRLRFDDAGDLERYFEVGAELPADLTVARALGAGELLPRSALGRTDGADTVTISLAVNALLVPSGVGPGSVVDVYVTGDAVSDLGSGPGSGPGGGAGRDGAALQGVRVVAAASAADSFAPGGDRQVELAVPDGAVAPFYALLGDLSSPVVSLAQVS